MVIVTGGTGHLGNVLVRMLLEQGEKVRVLVFPTDPIDHLDGLNIDFVYGDVRDFNSLKKAFDGCSVVYHLASYISIVPGKNKLLEQINIQGVKNVVRAVKFCSVDRLVYVSSVHAFKDIPHGDEINEQTEISPTQAIGNYGKSKAKATLYVRQSAKEEINAVICCPTGIIGPYDYKLSRMGKLYVDFIKNRLPVSFTGAYNFVDVRDVAQGLIQAAEMGKRGETYLLAGETIKMPKIIEYFSKYSGHKKPKFTIPIQIVYIIAPFIDFYYLVFKKAGNISLESIKIILSNANISCKKAQKEIGYHYRSMENSIKDMVDWFTKNKKLFKI